MPRITESLSVDKSTKADLKTAAEITNTTSAKLLKQFTDVLIREKNLLELIMSHTSTFDLETYLMDSLERMGAQANRYRSNNHYFKQLKEDKLAKEKLAKAPSVVELAIKENLKAFYEKEEGDTQTVGDLLYILKYTNKTDSKLTKALLSLEENNDQLIEMIAKLGYHVNASGFISKIEGEQL